MTQRVIRTKNGKPTTVPTEALKEKPRLIRPELDKDVADKIDALVTLKNEVTALNEQAKKMLGHRLEDISEIEKFLLTKAKEEKIKVFRGRLADIEIAPSASSSINPSKFLKYLKKIGLPQRFFDHISVSTGSAKKEFGEKPLVAAEVLKIDVEEYARVKVKEKA